MRTDLAALTACLLLTGVGGCSSAKRDIQAGASRVREAATAIRTDAQLIKDKAQDVIAELSDDVEYVTWAQDPASEKLAQIVDAATRIDHHAERVGLAATTITERSQDVKDITPLWQTLLGMSAWSLLWIGVAIVLAWFGLLPLVLRFLAGLALQVPALFKLLIPPSIRTSAKLAVEARAKSPENQELGAQITVDREDPRFDAAYRYYDKIAKAVKA